MLKNKSLAVADEAFLKLPLATRSPWLKHHGYIRATASAVRNEKGRRKFRRPF